MQLLTNLPANLMVLLQPVLAPIWVAYGFGDASSEGFGDKSQPIPQLLRFTLDFDVLNHLIRHLKNLNYIICEIMLKKNIRQGCSLVMKFG